VPGGECDAFARSEQMIRLTQILSLVVSTSELEFFFHQKGFEFERGRVLTSLHKAFESCKRLMTFASDLTSGQWVHEPFNIFELVEPTLR
jgi:hypothetical protein